MRKNMTYLPILLLLLCSLVVTGQAQTDITVHDPVVIRQDSTYYLFCTGPGIASWSSPDLEHWTRLAPVFPEKPTWTDGVVDSFPNHIWAPDISFHDGQYYLYYSVSAFAKNTSAIGVATSPTLHPEDPGFGWTDHGIVVESVPNRDMWNAIDPNLIFDEAGTPWLSFGSFWNGLKLVQLDSTLLAVAEPQEWHTIASRPRSPEIPSADPGDAAVEAPFIFKKNNYYYLFASYDYCCRGAESTYKVRVGRAESVEGPYLDREGVAMTQDGGTLLLEGNADWPGAGHNSTYTFDGKDYIFYHAYEGAKNGRPKLQYSELNWDAEGWPSLSRQVGK